MYQQERLVGILDYLHEHQSMSLGDVCSQFAVSRDTARRDIVKLCSQGTAIRTHGGLALPELEQTFLAYQERLLHFSVEKMRIGAAALPYLKEFGHYFFNASTTVSCMARQITQAMTVTTHSLDTAQILSDRGGIDLHLIGGCFNPKNRYFSDPRTLEKIESIHFDSTFLGTAAIAEDGFYYHDADDAAIALAASRRSSQTVILAEKAKFDRTSRYKGPSWKNVSLIITDQAPDTTTQQWALDTGIPIITAL